MTPNTPFPQVWDSTMLSDLTACGQKFNYAHMMHLRKPDPNVHLHFGACLAHGLEAVRRAYWKDKLSPAEALAKGTHALLLKWGDFAGEDLRGYKTLENCILALNDYFIEWPFEHDPLQPLMVAGEPAIEFSFALPLPNSRYLTGEPIIFCGRFDMLGVMDDIIFVVDEKTSGQLGKSWQLNWKLRSQFTAYCWGAREFGYPVTGALVRGICPLKEKTTFQQDIQNRPPWQIDRWLDQTLRKLERAHCQWHAQDWDLALDTACTNYGGCHYIDLCTSSNPERWYGSYEVRPWNPLERSET